MRFTAQIPAGCEEILTPEALRFVEELVRKFRPRVHELLEHRRERQLRFDAGEKPDFLPETAGIRESSWTVSPLPADLLDRRVEITGPVDRKMIINALNSGAKVFMADFEDSTSPTWENIVRGQLNLRDAVRRTIRFESPGGGKVYELAGGPAVLMVRPRGWHLFEKHALVDDQLAPAGIFDFALFFFHNAKDLLGRGTGPYFYLPKMQSHREARLWNEIFAHAEERLGIPRGTIKATVLIETLPAAFEMDEILFELREHSAGLNCGRWDYIFSFIKSFRADPAFVLPDRGLVTMSQPFLHAYTQLLVKTCHRREVHAIGGMAAQIPIKGDPAANEAALAKVRADKEREAADGHDGTWVAHPGLVAIAGEVFDREMPGPNQIENKRLDVATVAADLLRIPEGARTEEGMRHSISVSLRYLESWLGGSGCVPIGNLMEDAATAEISRTQIWQWIRHGSTLSDGRVVTAQLFRNILDEELIKVRGAAEQSGFDSGRFDDARDLFDRLSTADSFVEFLTLPAYEYLS